MSKTLFFTCVAMFGFSAQATTESYTADPAHTYPLFEVSHLGFSTQRGRFDKTAAKVAVDRATKKGSLEVTVDAASINTGWAKRDEHLRGPDFFQTDAFPTFTFKPRDFAIDGDKLTSVPGELTLLGVTKPVTLQVSRFQCGPHPMNKKPTCGVEASTTIKRSDFGMKYALPAVGDEVKIAVQMEAAKD